MRSTVKDGSMIVEAEDLRLRFGRREVLRGLSLTVRAGSVYALLGRNGSGKSTTVRCLRGHIKAHAGRAMLFGRDAWTERRHLMRRVGVVPETPDLPPEMTAHQTAAFVASLYPRWSEDEFQKRLERFDVSPRLRFSLLSKGQRKQVSLAMALAATPELLILDDPTLGLDAVARRMLFEELITELADRGCTVLLTTHDLAGIEGVADGVGILRDGALIVDDDLEALKREVRRITHPVAADDPSGPCAGKLRVLARRTHGDEVESIVTGVDAGVERDLQLRAAEAGGRIDTMSLEEIFIALCHGEMGGGR